LELVRLTPDFEFTPFDCGDADLNDFLVSDSKPHQDSLLAVTYLLIEDDNIIAYYNLINDKISKEDCESGNKWKKIRKLIEKGGRKGYSSYPAIKIGRMAVDKSRQREGIGELLLGFIRESCLIEIKSGCTFITVDAYNQSLGFYTKNDFAFLTEKDVGSDTRAMYFNLMQLYAAPSE
jgi:hypothetical protein